jgi:hypothetical protein
MLILQLSFSMQDKYMKAFHKVKQDKHIRFFSSLGSISLTLEFEDRTLDLEVTPLQATVLDAFQKRGKGWFHNSSFSPTHDTVLTDVYTWQEMSRRIGVEDEKTVQHALNFWINERVIRRREDGSYTSLDGKKESPDETPILRRSRNYIQVKYTNVGRYGNSRNRGGFRTRIAWPDPCRYGEAQLDGKYIVGFARKTDLSLQLRSL